MISTTGLDPSADIRRPNTQLRQVGRPGRYVCECSVSCTLVQSFSNRIHERQAPLDHGDSDNQQLWMPRIGRGLCINDYVRQFGMKSYGAGKIYHYRNYRAEDWDEVST